MKYILELYFFKTVLFLMSAVYKKRDYLYDYLKF